MFCGVIVVVHLLVVSGNPSRKKEINLRFRLVAFNTPDIVTKFQICYGKFLMLITENYFSILKGRN
jgi:hypothetical protein